MSESIEVTPDLLAGFLDEAPDYLSALEEGLLAFEAQAGSGTIALRDEADHERMNTVFRAAHSLKGIAASLGFKRIRDLTHVMESLFDQLRMGKRELTGSDVETLFGSLDTLRALVGELSEPGATPVSIDDSLAALNAILTASPSAAPPAPAAAPAAVAVAATATAPAGESYGPTDIDPDILQRFVETTAESIDELNQGLLALENAPRDAEVMNVVFRCAHNIKGASGMVGCTSMHRLTHELETVLDQLRKGAIETSGALMNALFSSVDRLRSDITLIREGHADRLGPPPVDLFAAWRRESDAPAAPADALRSDSTAGSGPADPGKAMVVDVHFKDSFEAPIQACILHNRLNDIGELVGCEPDVNKLDSEAKVERVVFRVITDRTPEAIEAIVRLYAIESVTITPAAGEPVQPGDPPVAAAAPVTASATPAASVSSATKPTPVASSEPTAPVAKAGEESGAPRAGETIRVDLERLDQLMNLGGELVITKARFVQISRRLGELFTRSNMNNLVEDLAERLSKLREQVGALNQPGDHGRILSDLSTATLHLAADFDVVKGLVKKVHASRSVLNGLSEAVHSLNRISEGMQKRIMQTRMVAIGPLFQRFRRVVRDISKSTGKKVDLILHGEATELDKRMIDELVDPLTHMVRNSVDHGLEKPADRIRAGKPETGQVTLNAYHRGRHICIEIRDDGKGINVEAVRRKLIERELLTPQQVEQLSDHEAIQYIFKPGFSTAEQVTDLSGRGMGMDIVRTKIENINGTVDVQSTPGQGTVVTINLPLTLAIISALMVRVGTCAYALPLETVVEIITVPRADVQHIHRQPVIRVRDRVIPLALLESVFSLTHDEQRTRNGNDSNYTVVVLTSGPDTIGLVVDELIGQEDIVIKDIAANFRSVDGIAGASIMGDGSVSLIIDVAEMAAAFARGGAARTRTNAPVEGTTLVPA